MKLSQFIDNHIIKKNYNFDPQTSKEIYDFFHATHPDNLLEFIKLFPQDILNQINNSYEYKSFLNNSDNTDNNINTIRNNKKYTYSNLTNIKASNSSTTRKTGNTSNTTNNNILNQKNCYSNNINTQSSTQSSEAYNEDSKLNPNILSSSRYQFWNNNNALNEVLKGFISHIEINHAYSLSNDLYSPNIYTLTQILDTYEITNTLELYNAMYLELLLNNSTLSFTNLYKICKTNQDFRKSIIYLPIPLYIITNHNQISLLNTSSAMIVFRYILRDLYFKNDLFLTEYQDIKTIIHSSIEQKVFKKMIFEYLDKLQISYINIIKFLEPAKPESTCSNINCTLGRSKTYSFALTLIKLKHEKINTSPLTNSPFFHALDNSLKNDIENITSNDYFNKSSLLSSTLFNSNLTKNKIKRSKEHLKSFMIKKLSINSLKHATLILDAYFKFINLTPHNTNIFYCEAFVAATDIYLQFKKFCDHLNINFKNKQEKQMINTIFNLLNQINNENEEQLTESISPSGMPFYSFKEIFDMPIYQDYLHDKVPSKIMKELINLRFHRN